MQTLGLRSVLQNAQTTGNGSAVDVSDSSLGATVYVEGTGTISGGTVLIEEALTTGYTGTWSLRATVTASGLTGGAVQAVALVGIVSAVRARISSTITGGGSITATVVAA